MPNAQGPGGYVNFAQYFNANEDTSKKAADKYGQQAKQAGQNAYGAINNAKSQFEGQVAGGGTNVGGGANPQGQYSGPGSVADVSLFKPAVEATQTAEQQLNGLGLVGKGGLDASGQARGDLSTLTNKANPNSSRGANNFSANLIGSAGRQQFDALRGYFNPTQQLNKAVTDTAAEGAAAQKAYGAAQQAKNTGAAAGALVNNSTQNAGVTTSGKPPAIPDSVTTVDQAVQAGYSQDQIVAKFGYAAYSDSVGNAFGRGQK